MTKIETVLIYAGIPALVIAVVVGLVFAGDTRRGGGRRYRPGRPYEFHPVWFLAAAQPSAEGAHRAALGDAPVRTAVADGPSRPAVADAPSRQALTGVTPPGPLLAAAPATGEWPAGDPARQNPTGGASDRW